MRFGLGQRILLIGALIVLTLVSTHIVTNHRLQALHDINQKLEQTQRVISLGQNHLSALKDMEIGKRGFLISGSDDFLEPYVSGSLHLRQNMEKLRRLTAGEPKKQLLLDEIENLSEQKLRIMQQAINLRRERGFDAARAFMLSSGAKDVMDAIRTSMSRLLEIERHELDRTEKQASLQDESLHMTIVTIDLILLGITAALLLLIWNTIVRPIHQLKQGADQLANGNYDIHLDVRGRHELAELAGSFNHMATVINERTQTLKTLIDAMVDSIVVANTQGIIEVFNPAAERLFGYTAREAKGNKVNMLMPSPHKQRHDSYIQRFLQSKKPKILGSTIELEAQRKDGTTVPVEIAINAVEVKQTIKFIAAIRDISDRK
ncbi:MAG: PAS domain S-box protein, partial [Zetaproteobacteria bacterium]